MSDNKTYLNVPYAQKDAAKALGARWDPANKKWYVLAGKDIAAFEQWFMDGEFSPSLVSPRQSTAAPNGGVFTQPTIENFKAYDGDVPPWE